MDRRNALKALLKAAITGTALAASSMAQAQGFGLNKYAEMVRLQQDTIAFHLAIKDRMDMQGGSLRTNDSYGNAIAGKIDNVLGYSMDNFTGDTKSAAALEECSKLFNDQNYIDTLSEEGLKRCMEVIVPVAVARTLLAKYRITFDPKKVNNWGRFSDLYQDMILAA